MGMGLPILLSLPEGEASRIILETDSGIIIPPEQPKLLAEAVVSLYEDTDMCAALAKASASAASNYSREKQANKMLEVLKDVADGGRKN